MLRFKIIALFIALIATETKCQTHANDRDEIYETIFKTLNRKDYKVRVDGKTNRQFMKDFGFIYGGKPIGDNDKLPSHSAEWISFIKSIDTAKLSDYSPKIKTKRRHSTVLMFAPIMFSKDGSMALCLSRIYEYESKSGGEQAWYFKKIDGKWKIIDTYTYAFFD